MVVRHRVSDPHGSASPKGGTFVATVLHSRVTQSKTCQISLIPPIS